MQKSVTEVTKAGSRALGAVYMKYLYAGGMTYEVYTKRIESVVEPMLFYCPGIRGTRKFPKAQSVLNKACRYYLGASKTASKIAARDDMGWASVDVKQMLNPCDWVRLKNMPESRVEYRVHQWAFSVTRSWENTMLKFIERLEIQQCIKKAFTQ